MGTPVRETTFPTQVDDVTSQASDTVDLVGLDGRKANMTIQSRDGGVIDIVPAGGTNVVAFTLAAGDFIPVLVKRVMSTNLTSATVFGYWST